MGTVESDSNDDVEDEVADCDGEIDVVTEVVFVVDVVIESALDSLPLLEVPVDFSGSLPFLAKLEVTTLSMRHETDKQVVLSFEPSTEFGSDWRKERYGSDGRDCGEADVSFFNDASAVAMTGF